MSHMVIYRGSDGKPGYHQTDDIHDAVGFVESMRNEQGVEHARIFRLEEVVFQYKPYYRVELADSLADGGEERPAVPPVPTEFNLANGSNGSNGATDDGFRPPLGDPVDAVGSFDDASDPGDELAATTSSMNSDAMIDRGEEGFGNNAGLGSKRGLFGR